MKILSALALSIGSIVCGLVACSDDGKDEANHFVNRSSVAAPAEHGATEAKPGRLEITSTPDTAHVYLNERYLGETQGADPLAVVIAAGTYQLRITRRDHLDAVKTVSVEDGIAVHYHATLQPWGKHHPKQEARFPEILWGLGTRMRGYLGAPDPTTSPPGEKHESWYDRYVIRGKKGDRRVLTYDKTSNASRKWGYGVFITTRDGTEVPLTVEKKWTGTPGITFLTFIFPMDGELVVNFYLRASGRGVPYTAHHGRNLPPISNHPEARLRRRRWPPVELETPENRAKRLELMKKLK